MTIQITHPLYDDKILDWNQMQHTYEGERRVKQFGTLYLPATSGMLADGIKVGEPGYEAYKAYVTRAVYHNLVKEAVTAMVGLIHKKPPDIKLPKKLEPLLQNCTKYKESAAMLLRKIHESQLIYGRCGLLVEIPDGGGPSTLPYLAHYTANSIINWDEEFNFAVMREYKYDRDSPLDFHWKSLTAYRICAMLDGKYVVQLVEQGGEGSEELRLEIEDDAIQPSLAGNTFDELPFVFINTNDLSPIPDEIPLLGLSNLALSIYRMEADYRLSLFQQAQETLVIIGGEKTEGSYRIGAGSVLELPRGATAQYVGVSASGLEQMKAALDADKLAASEQGVRIIDGSSSQQSGEALRIRMASKTATLTNIAKTGAEGLKQALQKCASLVGANPDEVEVNIDTDFTEVPLTGKELMDYVSAKTMGAPLSWETIHSIMKQKDMTSLTYEEEMDKVDAEL